MTTHDELNAARAALQRAQDTRQRRLDQEAQEKAAIVDAQARVQALEKQKAESDFQEAVQTNAVLHTANQQAVADFRAALDGLLSSFKALLSDLPGDQVQTTAHAQEQQARGAIGAIRRQMLIDFERQHPDQSGREAIAATGIDLLARAGQLRAPWPIETVLASFVRDAADDKEKRARVGICYALYGGELAFSPETTDAAVQAQLDAALHDRLSGGRA